MGKQKNPDYTKSKKELVSLFNNEKLRNGGKFGDYELFSYEDSEYGYKYKDKVIEYDLDSLEDENEPVTQEITENGITTVETLSIDEIEAEISKLLKLIGIASEKEQNSPEFTNNGKIFSDPDDDKDATQLKGDPLKGDQLEAEKEAFDKIAQDDLDKELFDAISKKDADLDTIKKLYNKGANVNTYFPESKTSGTQTTPLHQAVTFGNIEIAEFLIANHADVNATELDRDGKICSNNTPLHLAAEGRPEAVELLMNNGAKPDVGNRWGFTPAMLSCFCQDESSGKCLETLLEKGANVSHQGKHGEQAIHYAGLFGSEEKMDILLKNGADINAQDKDGDRAIDNHMDGEPDKTFLDYLTNNGSEPTQRQEEPVKNSSLLSKISGKISSVFKSSDNKENEPNKLKEAGLEALKEKAGSWGKVGSSGSTIDKSHLEALKGMPSREEQQEAIKASRNAIKDAIKALKNNDGRQAIDADKGAGSIQDRVGNSAGGSNVTINSGR